MRRLHRERRTGITAREHPEILGDVFAWNKLYRLSFWHAQGLEWPEGVRYEDQPTTTRAYLAGTFDVVPEVVYHWRIRQDGSSITQQRASVRDLSDRLLTKRMALDAVEEYDDAGTSAYFVDRVMAGDLHRYFTEIPGAPDEWWRLLRGRHPRPVGRAVAGRERPAARAPPGRLAGRARPAGRRGVGGALAADARRPGPARRRAPRRTPTCWTSPTSIPRRARAARPRGLTTAGRGRRSPGTKPAQGGDRLTGSRDGRWRALLDQRCSASVSPVSAPAADVAQVLRRQLVVLRPVLDGLPARAHRRDRPAPLDHRRLGAGRAGASPSRSRCWRDGTRRSSRWSSAAPRSSTRSRRWRSSRCCCRSPGSRRRRSSSAWRSTR